MSPYEQLEMDVFTLGRNGDFGGALEHIGAFESAAVTDQERHRATLLRGQVLHTTGQVHAAVAVYRQVLPLLAHDPLGQSVCCVELIAAANHVGDLALADTVARQAFRLLRREPLAVPSRERIYVNYAITRQLAHDHRGAIRWLHRALRRLERAAAPEAGDIACGLAVAWYGLAKSYTALGQLDRARAAIGRIRCEGEPQMALHLTALAEWRLAAQRDDWDEAQSRLDGAAATAVDPFMQQEVLAARAVTADARGDAGRRREYLDQLKALGVPLSFEIEMTIASSTLREGIQ